MKINFGLLVVPLLIIALIAVAYFWGPIRQWGLQSALGPNTSVLPVGSPLQIPALPLSLQGLKKQVLPGTPASAPAASPEIQVIAENLVTPWEALWLPDDSLLISQRSGSLLTIHPDGARFTISVPAQISQVSESGLLGLTIHPKFNQNQLVYLYFTTGQGNTLHNKVVRYRLTNHTLINEAVIVDNIPAGNFHDGGRLKFGSDGFLYVSTGDSGQDNLAQDPNSLAGKILRVGDGGGIPTDNPFPNSLVYSLGHRNVQGLTWDSSGNLWATEHGNSRHDELNLIKPGKNYGWPIIQGDEAKAGLTTPVINSGTSETWAPSGAAFLNDSIFFAGLRGETLYEAKLSGDKVTELTRHFSKEFGRLRDVVIGPDNALYILTNNTDGRGTPKQGDDKLIRIDPGSF